MDKSTAFRGCGFEPALSYHSAWFRWPARLRTRDRKHLPGCAMRYFASMDCRIRKDTHPRNGVDPSGFSLIALMIVVALLAIVALIALPSYNWAMQKTRRAEGKVLLHTIMAAEERFYSNTNR